MLDSESGYRPMLGCKVLQSVLHASGGSTAAPSRPGNGESAHEPFPVHTRVCAGDVLAHGAWTAVVVPCALVGTHRDYTSVRLGMGVEGWVSVDSCPCPPALGP